MITVVTNDKCLELRGLSTDTKPLNDHVGNGSTFFEMDTGDVYMLKEQVVGTLITQTWVKI